MSPRRLMSWPLLATAFSVLVASLGVPAKAEEALIIELTADREKLPVAMHQNLTLPKRTLIR